MKQLIQVGDQVFHVPPFIHRFGLRFHHDPGTPLRHIVVELVIYEYQALINWLGDACPVYELLKIPEILAFGLNCGFPPRDVALYLVWYLRGANYDRRWEIEDDERAAFNKKDGELYVCRSRKIED